MYIDDITLNQRSNQMKLLNIYQVYIHNISPIKKHRYGVWGRANLISDCNVKRNIQTIQTKGPMGLYRLSVLTAKIWICYINLYTTMSPLGVADCDSIQGVYLNKLESPRPKDAPCQIFSPVVHGKIFKGF